MAVAREALCWASGFLARGNCAALFLLFHGAREEPVRCLHGEPNNRSWPTQLRGVSFGVLFVRGSTKWRNMHINYIFKRPAVLLSGVEQLSMDGRD